MICLFLITETICTSPQPRKLSEDAYQDTKSMLNVNDTTKYSSGIRKSIRAEGSIQQLVKKCGCDVTQQALQDIFDSN